MSSKRSLVLTLATLAGLSALAPTPSATAAGLLVDRRGRALEIVSHSVDVTIDDQVARTRVTQVFENPSDRVEEATYLFPLPEGAGVSDFAMWIDGDRRPALIAEREKAVAVYESIVRSKRDPALLEQVGKNRFRMRVFPILPRAEVKIELTYDESLEVEDGVCRYVHPLRLDGVASTVTKDFTVSVRIRSAVPIGAVESPSHPIDVLRDEDGVVAGMEQTGATLDRDFVLRYAPAVDRLSINVAAQREGNEDGTFLLVLNPGRDDDAAVLAKDVLLVMDVSGSMEGAKLTTAIRALERFIDSLRPGDRFNVLAFGTAVRRFADGLIPIDDDSRERARSFVRGLVAAGGTAIDAALTAALADAEAARGADPDERRPVRILFVTDGDPTVGERDPRAILENVVARNAAKARVFAFGVESHVDGVLLNNLAAKTGGSAERVADGTELDEAVGALLRKISRPVLADLSIRVEGAGAYDLEPSSPPDLFAGGQVRVVGRYREPGPARVVLSATRLGRRVELEATVDLPSFARPDAPLRRLWAKRRIDFLQDEIWWHGDGASSELRDEIVRLSLAERILTPYTAMLVLETDADYRRFGLPVPERSVQELAAVAATETTPSSSTPTWSSAPSFAGRIGDAASVPRGPSSPGAGPVTTAPTLIVGMGRREVGGAGPRSSVPSGGTGAGGKKNRPAEGFERWQFWWEHNRDAVSVRTSNHAGSVQSGGAAYLSGLGRRSDTAPAVRPGLDVVIDRIVPALRAATQDADADVADAAVMALGKVVPAERADLVLDDLLAALSHPEETVRHASLLSLGVLGSERALEALDAVLRDRGRDPLERAFAAASLGTIGAPASVDVLMEVLRAEPATSIDVESMAILALSQFTVRTDEIVTFLADLLDEGSLDPTSAAQVPIALGRLSEPARKTLPQLLRLGAGRRTHARIAESCVLAIGRLATFEDAEAWTFLTETVQWGTNEQARHFALVALAEIAARAAADGAEGRRERFGETVAFLRQEFERPKSKPHQPWAALALSIVGTHLKETSSTRADIVDLLIDGFEETNDPSFKGAMATGLALLDAHAAGATLAGALSDADDELRGRLVAALGRLRHRESLGPLRQEFAAGEGRLRVKAAEGLAAMGDVASGPKVIAALSDAKVLTDCSGLARAIGDLAAPDAVDSLLTLIGDDTQPGIARAFACAALGRLAEKTDVPWNTRWAAGTNYRTVVPALYEILDIL